MAYRASQVIVIYVALTAASVLLTYFLAVAAGHVSAFLPYFGYIGDLPLESTFFTQCFVVDAALLSLVVQIRFVFASVRLAEARASGRSLAANKAAVCAGHAAAAGLFVLACFQESHAFHVHNLGLFFYLFGSTLYFALQSAVSKAAASSRRDEAVLATRIALNCLTFFFVFLFAVGHAVALARFDRPWEERYHWQMGDGGWLCHLFASAAQWSLLLLFQIYFLTFYHEFKNVMLSKTRIVVLSEEDQPGPRPATT